MQETSSVPVRDPEVGAATADGGARLIRLSGAWDIRALESRARGLQASLQQALGAREARWDLSQVQKLDHIGALHIWRAWNKRRPPQLVLRDEHEIFFANLEGADAAGLPARRFDPLAPVLMIGRAVLTFAEHALALVQLFGQIILDVGSAAKQPLRAPWRELSAGIFRVGAQALGITALVGFLIGVVLSYLSAEQLRSFGADSFIVNILGIGIIRELGPVICAVLVAGRSGSAITAQLGVMRVTEELDALAVMGIPHTLRLIMPKVVALAIALPLLILWTSSIALLGGAVSAKMQLGMTIYQFVSALPGAVPAVNVWLGVGKGVVFGALIALVACHFGLRIQPNTESLGIGTTNSVVTAITVVILADAAFAIIFSDIGIEMM